MLKIIYIVGNEVVRRQRLASVLRGFDPGWTVTEFTQIADAVRQVRDEPPHLIISDQTAPHKNGQGLLEQVREIAPATVRIIVSSEPGHSGHLGVAHQFLPNNLDSPHLETRVRQALAAQGSVTDAFAKMMAPLTAFPALPTIYTELIRELENDDSALERTAELLRRDGGILTRILQVANSPLFGGGRPVADSKSALLQLGTRNVESLVLSMRVFERYQRVHFPEMPVELIWRHSCSAARLAGELCRKRLGEDPANDAFFAGLVHDLGCLILMENLPDRFRASCQRALQEGRPLSLVEQEMFGASHETLSAFMLRLWGVSEAVINAVMHYTEPWAGPDAGYFTPTVALYIANIVTRHQSPPDRLPTPELDLEYLQAVGAPEICSSAKFAERN